ncbi:MAG: hypothetical protein ABL970_07760, partial [Nitrospira sp.]
RGLQSTRRAGEGNESPYSQAKQRFSSLMLNLNTVSADANGVSRAIRCTSKASARYHSYSGFSSG